MALVVGQTAVLSGDVTQLKAINARPPADVERMLGYQPGRLRQGYWICLLLGTLDESAFAFAGTTLRSGGKLGLPATSLAADRLRPSVHDTMMGKYGAADYTALQQHALRTITARGGDRLVKIVPETPHAQGLSPAVQYPMGGGSLQWTLKKPGKPFLVAAHVDPQGLARTPAFAVPIGEAAPYEGRSRLLHYLQTA